LKIPTTALDEVDLVPPPSGEARQVLSVKASNGLIAARTAGQVLYLAFGGKAGAKQGGFFPTGLNGSITSSSEPATAVKAAA
jgi:hypothetical protein